jgi:non-heme chloroperoxidase
VPFAVSAPLTAQQIAGAKLKVYPGASHGLATTHKDEFNADLLAFLTG